MVTKRQFWASVIILAFVNPFCGLAANSGLLIAGQPCYCRWAGIYPTVLAPFCADGHVDVVSLERQLHYQLQGGVHGFLVLGTIGEGEYTTFDERAEMIATAVRVAGPAIPVLVGIHTCNLDTAATQLIQAKELGAAAVLVKFIGKPHACPAEVIGFYSALSQMNLLPIFYYHYPSETKLHLSPQEVACILALPGVVGIKESTLNLREVRDHISLMRGRGKVFLSGTALNLTQFMALGGEGAICPEAVLLPGPTVMAFNFYIHGRCDEARAVQSELFEMMPILRARPTPPAMTRMMLMSAQDHLMPVPMGKDQPQARLKSALNCMGVPTPTRVKCPLPPLTAHEQSRVSSASCRLKEIDWCGAALKVPPVPLHRCPEDNDWGGLLRTGAFQLGSGVGKDFLRFQADGQAGF